MSIIGISFAFFLSLGNCISRKKADVNHVSVQHNHIDDCINRSTQTIDDDNDELLQDYSSRTVRERKKILKLKNFFCFLDRINGYSSEEFQINDDINRTESIKTTRKYL